MLSRSERMARPVCCSPSARLHVTTQSCHSLHAWQQRAASVRPGNMLRLSTSTNPACRVAISSPQAESATKQPSWHRSTAQPQHSTVCQSTATAPVHRWACQQAQPCMLSQALPLQLSLRYCRVHNLGVQGARMPHAKALHTHAQVRALTLQDTPSGCASRVGQTAEGVAAPESRTHTPMHAHP